MLLNGRNGPSTSALSSFYHSEDRFSRVRKYFSSFFEPCSGLNVSDASLSDKALLTSSTNHDRASFQNSKGKRAKFYNSLTLAMSLHRPRPKNGPTDKSKRDSLKPKCSSRKKSFSFFGSLGFKSINERPWDEYPALRDVPAPRSEPAFTNDSPNSIFGAESRMNSRSMFSRSMFSRSMFSRSMFSRSMFSRSMFSRSMFSRSMFSRYRSPTCKQKFSFNSRVSHLDVANVSLSDTSVPSTTCYYSGDVDYLTYPARPGRESRSKPATPEVSAAQLYARFLADIQKPPDESFQGLKRCSLEHGSGESEPENDIVFKTSELLAEKHFDKPWTISQSRDTFPPDSCEIKYGKTDTKMKEQKSSEAFIKSKISEASIKSKISEAYIKSKISETSIKSKISEASIKSKISETSIKSKSSEVSLKFKNSEASFKIKNPEAPKSGTTLSTDSAPDDRCVNFTTKSFPDGTSSRLDRFLENWKPRVPEKPPISSLYGKNLEMNLGAKSQKEDSEKETGGLFPVPSDPNIDYSGAEKNSQLIILGDPNDHESGENLIASGGSAALNSVQKLGVLDKNPCTSRGSRERETREFNKFSREIQEKGEIKVRKDEECEEENELNDCEDELNDCEDELSDPENELNDCENELSDPENELNHSENKLNHSENYLNDPENKLNHSEKKLNHSENHLNDPENKLNHSQNLIKANAEIIHPEKSITLAVCGFQVDVGNRSFEEELAWMQNTQNPLSHQCQNSVNSLASYLWPQPRNSSKNGTFSTPKEFCTFNEGSSDIILAESTPQNTRISPSSSEYREPSIKSVLDNSLDCIEGYYGDIPMSLFESFELNGTSGNASGKTFRNTSRNTSRNSRNASRNASKNTSENASRNTSRNASRNASRNTSENASKNSNSKNSQNSHMENSFIGVSHDLDFLAASSFLDSEERVFLEQNGQKYNDPFYRPCASVSPKNLFYDYEVDSKPLSKDTECFQNSFNEDFIAFRSFGRSEIHDHDISTLG